MNAIAEKTLFEQIYERLTVFITKMKLPIVSSFVSGFAAYMFCFTNRFEIMDDLCNFFSTGSGLSSGRWGLEIIDTFFPPVSIPWLNGILSLIMLTAVSCIVIQMFSIRKPLLQIVISAVLVTFPSQTNTFAYMFISAWYAFSLLLAVVSAYLLSQAKSIREFVLPAVTLILSLSIYQAYLAVAVSFLIVYAFKMTLSPEFKAKAIFKKCIFWIVSVALSVAVYYLINAVAMKITGIGYNSYAENNLAKGSLLFSIRVVYTSFIGYFIKGYYYIVSNRLSLVMHAVLCICVAVLTIVHFKNTKEKDKAAFAVLCLALLPLGVNCLRLASSQIHNLMLFSFTSVYILSAVIVEECLDLKGFAHFVWRDAVVLCLAVISCVNIAFANKVYLKMFMQFEQAQSFYSSVIACLNQQPEFSEDSVVAFVGSGDAIYDIPAIDTDKLAAIQLGLIGTYSQGEFIKYYCGPWLNIAGWDDTDRLAEDERVLAMSSFPYYGSIRKIDGFFVVKIE